MVTIQHALSIEPENKELLDIRQKVAVNKFHSFILTMIQALQGQEKVEKKRKQDEERLKQLKAHWIEVTVSC